MSDGTMPDPLAARRQFFARATPAGYAEEWAAQLAERRPQEAAARESAVLFRVGGRALALDARLVKAVVDAVPVCRIPHRGHGVLLGLVAYAGEVLPCCSLSRLLGLPEDVAAARMLVLEERPGVRWAVPVESVLGVPSAEREPRAEALPGWSELCIRDEQGSEIPLLAPELLFPRMLQAAG